MHTKPCSLPKIVGICKLASYFIVLVYRLEDFRPLNVYGVLSSGYID